MQKQTYKMICSLGFKMRKNIQQAHIALILYTAQFKQKKPNYDDSPSFQLNTNCDILF